MFDRSTRLISAAGTLALLPLAFATTGAPQQQLAVSLTATPVTIGVKVAMRPLDLASLSAADFGDHDTVR